MATTVGRCSNFDYCATADRRSDIEVPIGAPFVCPECGRILGAPPLAGQRGGQRFMLLAGVLVLVIGGTVYTTSRMVPRNTLAGILPPWVTAQPQPKIVTPPAVTAPNPTAKVPTATKAQAVLPPPQKPPEKVVLRLSGSNTVGAELAPRLAQAFLIANGDTGVVIQPTGKPDEVEIVGRHGADPETITVAAHGSATAFTDLVRGATDIGMASRRAKQTEHDGLASLGDLYAPSSEHVLALDGIAVIVNQSNAVEGLTKAQLHDVFSGAITNWSQLGRAPGDIHLYARDDKSGTFDTFKSLVLAGARVAPSAKRIEDSRELSADVAADPNGIGFIGLPYVLSARAIPVAETGAAALLPNRLTVGTEDYPLARRLYLYTGTQSSNPMVRRFAEFALSPAGQAIVEQVGFIPLTIKPEAAPVPQTASDKYRAVVGHATRLSTNFRFLPNSASLDNRGLRDLDRLVNYVVSAHTATTNLILVGFADNKGSPRGNLDVSRKRAEAVAAALAQRGVKVGRVAAFGSELPVADNASDDGREKNRRVEVYVQL